MAKKKKIGNKKSKKGIARVEDVEIAEGSLHQGVTGGLVGTPDVRAIERILENFAHNDIGGAGDPIGEDE